MTEIVDRVVLFKTRTPEKYTLIPKSKVIGQVNDVYQLAVYHGLEETRVLQNLGVKGVPSPIETRYNFPGRFKPFAHQIDTAAFLTLNPRAFVFNDAGTGKTLSALWAADYLMSLGRVKRCLVLCPLSIMQDAWLGGIGKSIIHRTAIAAHHPKASRRIEMIQGDYEFVVVNYDGLGLIAQEVVNDGRFDLVIVDEANFVKNVSTRRWKTLASILQPNTRLWMMTGTPASQSPVDAYGLAKLVNPNTVPKFFTAWRDKVMYKATMFKWLPKMGANEMVFDALQPAIRYTKAECTDLPPVITTTRDVALTPQQLKYYSQMKNQLLLTAAGETVSAVNAAIAVSKLLQISAGAAITDAKEVIEFDCTPRLNVLLEVLEETQRKVIVFAPFRSSIDVIYDFLIKNGVAADVIHGDVSVVKRTKLFKDFQETPSPRVMVVQPQSASHGVTLTAADYVVFYGPVMSVETYIQCIARADRIGQDSNKVTVVHLQGSDIERKMFARLEERVEGHEMLLNLYKEVVK